MIAVTVQLPGDGADIQVFCSPEAHEGDSDGISIGVLGEYPRDAVLPELSPLQAEVLAEVIKLMARVARGGGVGIR